MSAWKQACASPTPSSVVIPKGTFLSNELKIEGPCKAPIEFHLQATLKAPADPRKMMGGGEWITFRNIDHFTLLGGGVFDGQGKTAWTQNDCKQTGKCSKLPNVINYTSLISLFWFLIFLHFSNCNIHIINDFMYFTEPQLQLPHQFGPSRCNYS